MSLHDVLMGLAAGLSAVNALGLAVIAWRGGRWTGTVDSRLRAIERHLDL